MTVEDLKYFDLLKKKIVSTMQQSYPPISPTIEDWKGQEIVEFQEDLQLKMNEHLSEKWFYTHMKSSGEKLPRIDILNILSKYAGYTGWPDFKYRNGYIPDSVIKKENSNMYFIIIPVIVAVLLTILFFISKLFYTREYRFCCIDANTLEPVNKHPVEVSIFHDNQSPVSVLCDSMGCFSVKTGERMIQFIIRTPYYRIDTITRVLDKFNREEAIKLRTDDYALMILYFSQSNIIDWKKRRERLDAMFDANAVIYQVFTPENTGMDIYNKQEFIDKLTMPVNSLKDLEILDTQYSANKISVLRFRQKGGIE